MGCAMQNLSPGIQGQRRPRSACTSMQSGQGCHCLLTELLDIKECISGEQRPRKYFAHVQGDFKSVHFVHVRRHLCLLNSFGAKFHTIFVFCFFILTKYLLERRLYVKLKD